MVPPGAVHLRYPRISGTAVRLGIDAPPAVVGFESKGGRSYPQMDGVVVAEELSAKLVG